MIRVDYICTKDINRVAKIHSSKKYANWNFKIVDGEYRFYPPITVDEEEDYFDDFDFSKDEDSSWMDNILSTTEEKKPLPMFGELWNTASKFFNENIVSPIEDKKIARISKMGGAARIDKYKDMEDPIKVSKSGARIKKDKYLMFEDDDDNYKLYRVKQNRNCLARIEKYKTIEADVCDVVSDYQDALVVVTDSLTSLIGPNNKNVEVLSMDENLA
jgi:hypothetical protein